MRRRVLKTVVGFAAWATVLGLSAETARAAGWADALIREQSHDFGPVPRGAKVRHPFVLINVLNEPVTIVNVRASCGCTTGQATASVVPPGKSAVVEAEMDTRNFVGKKATVLYVTVSTPRGREAEIRLGVSSTILGDIVLNPGTIDFGAVTRGQSATQTLTVDRVGMPTWQVSRMVSACKAIDATLTETARNGQTVSYLLKVVTKPDAPAGTIRDEIRLLTNDPETPVFPVQVTGTVRGELSASPALLALGKVTSAAGVRGRFLIRGSKPFIIRAIEGESQGFQATADDAKARPVHLVTVHYQPVEATDRGDLHHVFRLHTDLVGEPPLELNATVRVEP